MPAILAAARVAKGMHVLDVYTGRSREPPWSEGRKSFRTFAHEAI
ncbi:hypothetical protein PZN02_005395 [Sinorhizobium garamanticum]|uniref:Uncharacterized protein n=1 Tax=Sinorhizobium garamanticum TaxID=680247 RepID=A0ABY8DGM1_9HYPH|nr:hypothetical protein [Sinorhizobium garamanticum]WEX90048.1 hypothetical protein PZN02_005395 [Sinorhizobium garamanticum]